MFHFSLYILLFLWLCFFVCELLLSFFLRVCFNKSKKKGKNPKRKRIFFLFSIFLLVSLLLYLVAFELLLVKFDSSKFCAEIFFYLIFVRYFMYCVFEQVLLSELQSVVVRSVDRALSRQWTISKINWSEISVWLCVFERISM